MKVEPPRRRFVVAEAGAHNQRPHAIQPQAQGHRMNKSVEQAVHCTLYYGLQRLRRRPISEFIKRLQDLERLDKRTFDRRMHERLVDMLRYAHATTPLYAAGPWRERLWSQDPGRIDAWPVLERRTVRADMTQLRARRPIRGAFVRNSSASSGEPLRVVWSPGGAGWGWASEYRAMLWHGVPPGARTLLMWGQGHWFQDWVKNCKFFRTSELTPQRLEEAAHWLLTRRPDLCQGLPSALARLARHVRTHHPDAPKPLVPYAKVGGEQVYAFQREEIERHLGARVVEMYGCTEVGPIAAECPAGSLHVHAENVYLEVFHGDQPAAPGECGDIVVTTLSNHAMPLIRCRIGDTGSIRPEPCACGRPQPVLDNLIGRAADVFVTADGAEVHGSVLGRNFSTVLADTPLGAIQQSLFQQIDARRWKVLVESSDGFDHTLAAKLTRFVRANFGEECEVEIERVAVVPREPSGKFRYYRPSRLACTAESSPSPARPAEVRELSNPDVRASE